MRPSNPAKRKMTKEERTRQVRRQRIILGAVLACAILYLAIALYYVGHFMPRSSVNGIDVSRDSFKEASAALKEASGDYTLSVTGPGDQLEIIRGADISLEVTGTDNLKRIMWHQGVFAWPARLFQKKEYEADLDVAYNTSSLETAMNNLEMLDTSGMTAPSDAHLEVADDGSCEIIPESDGTTLDVESAKGQIREAVDAALPSVDLTASQVLPTIFSDNESLMTRRDEWNAYLVSAGLTYEIADTTEVLNGSVIASLLTDDGEHVSLDDDKIAHLMAVWKDLHDTYGRSFTFTKHDGTTTTIDAYGDYGWSLDEEDTGADVKEKILAGDAGSYVCQYYHEPLSKENGGLGGTYVEVSIYEQHLWVYKDGKCVVDTDIVTGRPVHGATTYLGCYAIKRKDTDVILGEEDVQGYESPVNWWIPFNGGEGFHDAPWRDAFGGKIWIESGSHGCVNVPEDVMESVFNNVEVGEAVVIWGNEYDDGVNDIDHDEVDVDYYYDVYYGSGED